MQIVGREYVWIRVDSWSTIAYPAIMVGVLTLAGEIAVSMGWLKGWYSSPYVAICAIAANRICLRAGLWCAVFSILAHSYVFVGTRWAWEWPPVEQALSYASMLVVPYLVGRRERVITLSPHDDSGALGSSVALPFTQDGNSHSERRMFWVVEPSHNWRDDNHLGSEYGRIYLDHVRRTQRGPLLPWIVADMIKAGRWTGVEIGFLSAVGRAASTSSRSDVLLISRTQNDSDDA